MHTNRSKAAGLLAAGLFLFFPLALGRAGTQAEGYFDERGKAAVRASVPAEEQRYLVDVGARLVYPRRDAHVEFQAKQALVYLQFEEPLSAPERERLAREGVRFFDAVARTTYLARIRESALPVLTASPRLRGVVPVIYADRLTAGLYRGQVGPYALDTDGSWLLYVRFYADVSLPHALYVLERAGVKPDPDQGFLVNRQLLVHATWEQVFGLAETHVVRSMSAVPPPPRDDNVVSAAISNVDDVQAAPFNLTGDGVDVGQWESGNPQLNHGDLTPRVTVIDAGAGETGHATHVAGTIMGTGTGDPTALGMAPGVDELFNYSSAGSTATEHQNAVTNEGIDLANSSWGFAAGWEPDGGGGWTDEGNDDFFGLYDTEARDYDSMVLATGLTVMKSSGNDQNDFDPGNPADHDGILGGDGFYYDLITLHGNAKNIVTVGALEMDGVTLAAFSSSGPANDGRIKPDVVADGRSLWSTCSLTQDAALYCSRSGTSMSAPTVTGLTALLFERYRQQYIGFSPTPDVVKALLVNTAQDLGRPGPDYLFGHGLADALAAVNTIDLGRIRILTDAVDQGEFDEFLVQVLGSAGRLQATLVWLDPPGLANSGDPDLINDLDLLLIDPANGLHYPWSGPGTGVANVANPATATGPNTVDNVETATVDLPDTGFWRVRVTGTGVPSGPQGYALVLDNSLLLPDEPEITVTLGPSLPVTCPGSPSYQEVTIYNSGGGVLLVNDIELPAGSPITLAGGPSTPFPIQPGGQVTLSLRFDPDDFYLGVIAILQIHSNDADEPLLAYSLLGQAGNPEANAVGTPEVGGVLVNVPQLVHFDVYNTGTCNLTLTGIAWAISGTSADVETPDFDEGFIDTVFPGEHVSYPVSVTMLAPGTFTIGFAAITDDTENPNLGLSTVFTAPPGDIEVLGPTDFGVVCPEEPATLEVDVCNTGPNPLTVTALGLTGIPEFDIIDSPFPGVVPAGTCLPITIRYAPTPSPVPDVGTLMIESDDPDEPVVERNIQGQSGIPDIELFVPATGDFGNVLVGDTSTLDVEIRNLGPCELVLTAIQIVGLDVGDFDPPPIAGPTTVPAGETLVLPLTYRPTDFEPDSGTLNVFTNDPTEPFVAAALTGRSEPPILATSGPTDFGLVCVGDSSELVYWVCNVGFNHLWVADVSFAEGSDGFTVVDSPFPAPISHDFCLPIVVRYEPDVLIPEPGAILRFYTFDPEEPEEEVEYVAFSATGDVKTALEANGMFGNVKFGDFRTLEYQITNQGLCNLELVSLARTGGSPEFDYGQQPGSPAFPLSLFPGESVAVQLRYAPTDIGTDPLEFDTATFRLTTDDPDTPTRDFQVQGRSMPPDIEFSGSTDFGVVCPDQQAELTVWICNVGFNDLAVPSVMFEEPCEDFTLIGSPFPTIISKDFCMPLVIRYTPQTTGDHTCTLRILSTDPDEPLLLVPVTGTTPEVSLDTPGDFQFPPTVVQQVDPACQSSFPFTITNTGPCNVEILSVSVVPGDDHYTDYQLEGLPALPATIQPGNSLGEGHGRIVFRPTIVRHRIQAAVEIVWVSHVTGIGETSSHRLDLCGEGVNTGARLLVTQGGVPVPHVDKIELWEIEDYGGPNQTSHWLFTHLDVPLSSVDEDPPCAGFFFHVEWGAETNPVVLEPGWYRAMSAIGTMSPVDLNVEFYIPTVCDFVHDVVIDYP